MKIKAKKEHGEVKRSRLQTGGGSAIEMSSLSSSVAEVIGAQMDKPSSSFDSDANCNHESRRTEPLQETTLRTNCLTPKRPVSPKRAKRLPDEDIIEMARERHAIQMEILRLKKQNEHLKTEILQQIRAKVADSVDVMASILEME